MKHLLNPCHVRSSIGWVVCLLLVTACGGPTTTTQPDDANAGGGPTKASDDKKAEVPQEPLVYQLSARPPKQPWIVSALWTRKQQSLFFTTVTGERWHLTLDQGTLVKENTLGESGETLHLGREGRLVLALGGIPRMLDTTTGTELMRFANWKGAELVEWDEAGTHFVLGRTNGEMAMWELDQMSGLQEGERLEDYLRRQEPIVEMAVLGKPTAMALTPEGKVVIALDRQNKKGDLFVIDMAKKSSDLTFFGRAKDTVTALEVSPSGQYVAALSQDHSVVVARVGKQGFRSWARTIKADGLAWTPSNELVIHDLNGSMYAVEVDKGEEQWRLEHAVPFNHCWTGERDLVCTEGNALMVISGDGRIKATIAAWNDKHLVFAEDGTHAGNARASKWLSATRKGAAAKVPAAELDAKVDKQAIRTLLMR